MKAPGRSVFSVARDKERISLMRLALSIADADLARAFDDEPELISMVMHLQTECFSLTHSDDLHGRLFIRCKTFESSPGAYIFQIVRKSFHVAQYIVEN